MLKALKRILSEITRGDESDLDAPRDACHYGLVCDITYTIERRAGRDIPVAEFGIKQVDSQLVLCRATGADAVHEMQKLDITYCGHAFIYGEMRDGYFEMTTATRCRWDGISRGHRA